MAEVEPVGGKGDTQVAERMPHLLGEGGRDHRAVRSRSVLTRDEHLRAPVTAVGFGKCTRAETDFMNMDVCR